MKRARSFCSPDKDGIYFNKDANYIIVKIKDACFPCLIIGKERKSLIEVLKILNSLMPIRESFSSFGLNLKKCMEDNPEATLKVMRKRCQTEIERMKGTGYTAKKNIEDWESVLRGAGKNPPEELRNLLESTIEELKKAKIRNNQSCRRNKKRR